MSRYTDDRGEGAVSCAGLYMKGNGSQGMGKRNRNRNRRSRTRLERLATGILTPLFLIHLQLQGAMAQGRKAANYSDATPISLIVTNNCPETIWPGIGTQNGIGPGTGGFELDPTFSLQLWVSADWQGRIWGRTNCSFNADGTGPSNLNGVNGGGAACTTGDCFGRLDCVFTVSKGQKFVST